ncbi:MAG: hypothetical protein ACT4QG_17005 [Sporichthyaceae bacterium]
MTVVDSTTRRQSDHEPGLPQLPLDSPPRTVVESVREMPQDLLGRWLPPSTASSLPGGLSDLAALTRMPATVPYQLAGLVLRVPTAQAGDPWEVAALRECTAVDLARLRVVPLHFDGHSVHYASPDVPAPGLSDAVANAFGVDRARPTLCTPESFGEWSLPPDPGRRPMPPVLPTPPTDSVAWLAQMRRSPLPSALLRRASAAAGTSAAAAVVAGDARAYDMLAPLLRRLTGLPVTRAEVPPDVHDWWSSGSEVPFEPTPTELVEQVRGVSAGLRGLGWHAALSGLPVDQRVRVAAWALGAPWLSSELAVLVAARWPSAVGESLTDPNWAVRPGRPEPSGLILGVPPIDPTPDPARDAYAEALLARPFADALGDDVAAEAMSLVQSGSTLDGALTELAPELSASALLAGHAGVPTVELDPRPRTEAWIDALGRPCRATTWDDPIGAVNERVLVEPDVVPVRQDADGTLLIAVADPLTPGLAERLAVAAAAPVRIAVAAREEIARARHRLLARTPGWGPAQWPEPEPIARPAEESAHRLLTPGQKVVLAAGGLVVAIAALLAPWHTATALVGVVLAILVATGLHRCRLALRWGATPRHGEAPTEADLPTTTVLVSLTDSRRDLSAVLRDLGRFDYPLDRLDVLMLVHASDASRRAALADAALPAHVDVLVVPATNAAGGHKAANVGLLHARGRYTLLHHPDASPRSIPLRQAAHAFVEAPPDVVCLQARLRARTTATGVLGRVLAGLYAGAFGGIVALSSGRAAIPLGPTAAFFRTDWLRTTGGWDPHNRAAQADLGVRIRRLGARAELLDAVVDHPVESDARGWLRRCVGGVAGYVQTYLLHMRRPRRLAADLGLRRFLGFQCALGGTLVTVVALPVLWLLVGLWTAGAADWAARVFPVSPGATVAVLGHATAMFVCAYLLVRPTPVRTRCRRLLFSPWYWSLRWGFATHGFRRRGGALRRPVKS